MRETLHACRRARRETLGDKHPSTLLSLNNLGMLLRAQGKLEEAAPLCREALQAQRETLGDKHPSTLLSATPDRSPDPRRAPPRRRRCVEPKEDKKS